MPSAPSSSTVPEAPAAPSPPFAADRRQALRRLAFAAALATAVGVALYSLPGLDELSARLARAAPGWLAVALALEVASCLAFVVAYRAVLCRRLPWRLSYQVGMATQGANVLLPAGGASGLTLGAVALRRAGMATDRVARRSVAFFLITSSVNFATAVVAGAALALGLLAGDAPTALTAGPAALAAAVIAGTLALARMPDRGRARGGRIDRARAKAGGALKDGIRDARELVRSGDRAVILGAVGYMALDACALAATFAAVGSPPPVGVLALAYVIGQLGGLVPLPGGAGGTDGGLIAALALYGTPLTVAAAAVLAYRAFQLGLPALLGTLAVTHLPNALRAHPGAARLCDPC